MGSFCIEGDKNYGEEDYKNLNMSMKGQYNNFKDFSNFEIKVTSQTLINEDQYNIDGTLYDKQGKSLFTGKISRQEVSIQIKSISNENMSDISLEGKFDEFKRKYFGILKEKYSVKIEGRFWIEIIENNIWSAIMITGNNISNRSIQSDLTKPK